MGKVVIVKAFVGSLLGFATAVVIFAVAAGLALANDSFIMNGPDVVGIRTDPFGWTMIGLAALAVLVLIGATMGLFVAWLGAVLNTANLADKTWFVVLLVGGLVSVGFLATLAYVIAGPDGHPTAVPARDGRNRSVQPQLTPASGETARAYRQG
jgi:hypothetical protein